MKKTIYLFSFFVLVTLGMIPQLNAQTLKHSYTFEEGTYDVSKKIIYDQVGTANGTILGNGITFKNGSVANTNYQKEYDSHISFDGTALALNKYSAITMEYYITTSSYATNYWTMFAYFGADGGGNSFYSTLLGNTGQSRASLNNTYYATNAAKLAVRTSHHCVAVLKPTVATPTDTTLGSLAWYIDGILIQSTPLTKADTAAVKNISTKNNWIFKGPWSDNRWLGTLHEFNLYDGAMDAATVAAQYGKFNSQLATLTVTAGTLKPAFAAGIFDYALHLTSATTTLDIAATASQVGAVIKGTGTYDVSGNQGVIKVYVDTAKTVPYFIHWEKPITAELKHAYTFADNTANDAVGSANGTLVGTNYKVANGAYITTAGGALTTAGASSHITLPVNKIALNKYPSFSMEAYILGTTTGNPNTFISYFGGQAFWGVNHYYLNATGSTMSGNILYNPWSGSTGAGFGTTLNGVGHHIVTVVVSDTMYSYTDGVLSNKIVLGGENQIFNIANDTAYIARGGYRGDKNFIGTISEFNIYKGALDAATISSRSTTFHNADALLNSMTISAGNLKPAFNTVDTLFDAVLPVGTTSVKLAAVPSNALSTIADTGTIDISGGAVTRKVIVTAPDGVSKTYRNVIVRTISKDSTLTNLTVNGVTITGFAPDTYTYEVKLPTNSTIPTVAVTTAFKYATAVVTPATILPGTTKIVVTAENGTSKTTYNVNFTFTDPTLAVLPAGLKIEDLSPKDSITVSAANLTSDITITAPTGITVNPSTIAKASIVAAKVYVNYDGITSVNDSIVFTSGTLVKKVGIKTVSNAACFKPLYATGNIISNPYFNNLTGYAGWGSRAITNDAAEVYCGSGSYKTSGACGGSLDYSLTSKVQANTVYRLRAMVKTTGKYKFIINGCNVGGSANYYLDVNTSDAWQSVVFTFTTGATMDANQNLFFNSCEGYNGTLAFVDNLELYKLPLYVTPATVDFIGTSTKDVTVKAQVLADSITVTAPAGFSVPKAKLAPDKTSTLSITFDGVAAASGYVYLTSGTNKDSVLVSGTVEPTIAINSSYLGFDELNPKDSIVVDGGNLTSDITITAPAGITVNPSTILKSNATNVKVMVTYDGTSSVNDNISITSGLLSKTVAVKAAPNTSCFTKLYVNGTNLVADPYLNNLSTFFGWGAKTTNTDPAFVYFGTRSGKVSGGSIDVHLTGGMQINTTYRVKAKVWKVSGTIQVGVFGWNGAAADINHEITVVDSWQDVDFTFTTGATLGGGQGVFFNNGVGYIDNWEIYALSNDATLSDLKVNAGSVAGFTPGTNTYSVVLPYGTTVVPTVSATVNEPNATTVITQAASVSGSATVVVTAMDGTTKLTYTINFSVNPVSVASVKNDAVTVRPTISSENFSVEFAGKTGTITVYDMKGKVVTIKKANKSNEIITVPAAGIYLMKINVGGVVKTVKIVKTN
jgi:hypothetical protein